jgi:hypothetical protein
MRKSMHVNRLFGDQLWKERLTFVSGNILGLGLILVKLRPIIAQLQLESFFDIVLYTTLLFLMTAAFSAIIFAVIHIVFRGAWLATFNKKRRVQIQEKKIVENFDNFCVLSYFAVFILSVCTILSILVTFGTSLIIIFKDITNFYFPSIKYI